jgi:NAD(P)-dependent dehydrogenase (short-subunit alcohol dehydrogenase family)
MGPQAVDYGNATDTMALPVDKVMLPISTIVASQFITARATARYMRRQGSGVVVFLSATPSQGAPKTSAIGAAYGALESLTRSLAVDLGVRVVCMRSIGMAETRMMQQTYGQSRGWSPELDHLAVCSVLHLPGVLEDVPGDPAGGVARGPAVGYHR